VTWPFWEWIALIDLYKYAKYDAAEYYRNCAWRQCERGKQKDMRKMLWHSCQTQQITNKMNCTTEVARTLATQRIDISARHLAESGSTWRTSCMKKSRAEAAVAHMPNVEATWGSSRSFPFQWGSEQTRIFFWVSFAPAFLVPFWPLSHSVVLSKSVLLCY